MVDGRPGVNAFPLRKPVPASAIHAASTPDGRALINCMIELATGRSLAVSAARDDTRFLVFLPSRLQTLNTYTIASLADGAFDGQRAPLQEDSV